MAKQRLVRDSRTGRFIAKSGPVPTQARLQKDVAVRVRRDPKTGQFTKKGKPTAKVYRHPRTGKFISKDTAKLVSKKVITQADIDRIMDISPKLRKAIARASAQKQGRARAAIRRNLITHLEAQGKTIK